MSDLQGDLGKKCPALRVMRDICNGSKHGGLDRTNNPMIRKTKRYDGAFDADVFSDTFDISVLEVELTNGDKAYFDDLVQEALQFWKQTIESS